MIGMPQLRSVSRPGDTLARFACLRLFLVARHIRIYQYELHPLFEENGKRWEQVANYEFVNNLISEYEFSRYSKITANNVFALELQVEIHFERER